MPTRVPYLYIAFMKENLKVISKAYIKAIVSVIRIVEKQRDEKIKSDHNPGKSLKLIIML